MGKYVAPVHHGDGASNMRNGHGERRRRFGEIKGRVLCGGIDRAWVRLYTAIHREENRDLWMYFFLLQAETQTGEQKRSSIPTFHHPEPFFSLVATGWLSVVKQALSLLTQTPPALPN